MGARELLADLADVGLTVTADGDRLVIRPASKLTDTMREALREAKPDLLVLLAPSDQANAPAATFLARRARLLRWGWPKAEAEMLAERLAKREREQDDRVSCTDCRHFWPGRCGNHRAALLHSHEVGRDLAAMLQRCPGFQPSR
jgi:virulence-associated protein VagC